MLVLRNAGRSQLLPSGQRQIHAPAATTLFPLSATNDEVLGRVEEMCSEVGTQSGGHRARALLQFHRQWHEKLEGHARALAVNGPHRMTPQEMFNHHLACNLASALAWAAQVLQRYEPNHLPGEPVRMGAELTRMLKLESGATFKSLGVGQALAYASVVPPQLHVDFGIVLTKEQAQEASRMIESAGGLHLGEQQILALRDYAHSDTGTFNLLRSLQVLQKHLPHEPLTALVQGVVDAFLGAVDVLAASPAFRIEDATVCKGLKLDPFLMHLLERMYSDSLPYEIDRPSSGTLDPVQSYAGREGYEHEIVFDHAQAVELSCFHEPRTVHEKEALLLPGQRFDLSSREEVHRQGGEGSIHYTRYVAERRPAQ